MIDRLNSLLLFCTALILVGCASWQQTDLTNEGDWAFTGKMAIKNAQEGSSFNVTWQQNGQSYDIELSGPLGQGRMTIQGDNHQVTLYQGNDQWTANSLEDLLWDIQQVQLPLDYLQYWVRALPKPYEPFDQTLDLDNNQVIELRQAGWLVEYSSYHPTSPAMPRKLSFIRNENSGKLVIREWSLLQLPNQ
jgi:outer membrane lipoprotein LolB